MGKMLWVDLSKGELKDEALDEKLCREFIGGYGIGARLLYSRQKGGVDPLGPENTLGFTTGPITGTAVPFGSRYAVVTKSPLTGGWGDANSGGDFGAYLKFAGYDNVFFTGISEKPVYLFIKDGKAELRDATHLWGKTTAETEAMLETELGKGTRVASIGPAGEKLSLISGITNNKGRGAYRSGIGAVMGSKKLKAVAVIGTLKIPIADDEKLKSLRKEYVAKMKGPGVAMFRSRGTSDGARSAYNGDAPVKNWGGTGDNFPNANLLNSAHVIELMQGREGCYRCPMACGGRMKAGTEYKYEAGAHKPEYETLAAFGAMCLNNNLESIIMACRICDLYGIDTISTGGTIAFAIECYENGLITKEDTDDIELTWGNHRAIIAMIEKMGKREGFGDVLADGCKVASEKIGKDSDKYAMHVRGQELPMHDPRRAPSYATVYHTDPTPARHMQGSCTGAELGRQRPGIGVPPLERYTYSGKGKYEVIFRNQTQLVNTAGGCAFAGIGGMPFNWVDIFLPLVTGWKLSPEEIARTCERITTIRQVFNVREGLSPKDFKLPGRAIGEPPLMGGPNSNITVDEDTLVNEYYKAMDWDPETGKPSQKKLLALGLDDVAKDLWH